MKFRLIAILIAAAVLVGNAGASNAEVGYCTGTYGGGDYRISYVPHNSPAISAVLSTPALKSTVINVIDDRVTIKLGQNDGVSVGDKFRIERPFAGASVGDANRAICEVAITRVGAIDCSGLTLGDIPVRSGDLAVSTRLNKRIVPRTFDIPSVVASADQMPKLAEKPMEPVFYPKLKPAEIAVKPPVVSLPRPVEARPAALPDPASSMVQDYLSEIPTKQLDIWAEGHDPLKVHIANAEHVKGYRTVFFDFAKQAFAEWTRASGNKVQFEYVDSADKADIEVTWTYERADLEGHNELGITHTLRSDEGIEKAKVRLLTSSAERGVRVTDSAMWITTLHEIGHALGLSHSSDRNDVMTPVVALSQSGETAIAGLTARDVSSIKHLYGDSSVHADIVRRHQQAIASRSESVEPETN